MQHSIARPIVAGPGLGLAGGGTSDAGGLIIIGGHIVRIPPWSPILALLGVILSVIGGLALAEAWSSDRDIILLPTGLLVGGAGLISTVIGGIAIWARLSRN